ncbi:stalk domain-containing protein [Crassaminicella indica]|uniref:Copper amine oxidase N-terminal domain-containing protein n=1 Tax=Crassaminicella indica TaxID=2855394 RepID=A0ABX8RGB5_9CLOT|nr:stalk domain-containing protein [Crassaminicella indica]QXM06745.1 copper amine oxidase N-terminal domain-containing protein [Crassaminicella indica]
MNNLLSKYKHFITGIIIGGILGAGTLSYAAISGPISAWVKENISFEFNGEKKELPKSDKVLVYENKVYVPAWFIAENLGATLEWNKGRKTIQINAKNQKEKEEKQIKIPTEDYETMPVKKLVDDVLITVNSISIDTDETRVYLKVKNIGEKDIVIEQGKTKLVANNKTYEQKDIVSKVLHAFSQIWFNNIKEDDEVEGMIKLPPIKKDTKNVTLILKMLQNDGSGKETEIKFNIKLK